MKMHEKQKRQQNFSKKRFSISLIYFFQILWKIWSNILVSQLKKITLLTDILHRKVE